MKGKQEPGPGGTGLWITQSHEWRGWERLGGAGGAVFDRGGMGFGNTRRGRDRGMGPDGEGSRVFHGSGKTKEAQKGSWDTLGLMGPKGHVCHCCCCACPWSFEFEARALRGLRAQCWRSTLTLLPQGVFSLVTA